jgi:uncharacterized membrane protein
MAKKRPGRYRQAFFAGLATLLPTLLTILVISLCYNVLDQKIARPITGAIKNALRTETAKQYYWKSVRNLQDFQLDEKIAEELPDTVSFSKRVDAHVPNWIGFVIALALVFAVGFLFRGYLGRQTVRLLESWVLRIPLIRTIYPYAKQVTEFFFREKTAIQYQRCVAFEYPRKGIYSIGFITSEGFRQVCEASGVEIVTIFVPSSPTPITGYTILVPKDSVIHLDLSVDEALPFIISGGVILPPSQTSPLALKTRRLDPPREGGLAPTVETPDRS